MLNSTLDIFSIGIGPSSSHTVGPMRAAKAFCESIPNLNAITRIQVTLHGSLAHTGKGHGTPAAVLMGLEGEEPATVDALAIPRRVITILESHQIQCLGAHRIHFDFNADLLFDFEKLLPGHSNGLCFQAFKESCLVHEAIYYSIGGGFIATPQQLQQSQAPLSVPYPFYTGNELFSHCAQQSCSVAELMLSNEQYCHPEVDIKARLLHIETVMQESIESGIHANNKNKNDLLMVKRRAPAIYQQVITDGPLNYAHPHKMNWLNVYAMAVSEENAAGHRVVTAPTNGAAGILPAIIRYHREYDQCSCDESVIALILTASAICNLYQSRASISGAEMGCQGEIGVACSMAAAGLTAARGGTWVQVENAAEIAMEHNLGLTCDPVGGKVQVPCIERNGMGAVKAVTASSLALTSQDSGYVRLDQVIDTMREIGHNMSSIYKETSKGGLAVNVTEC